MQAVLGAGVVVVGLVCLWLTLRASSLRLHRAARIGSIVLSAAGGMLLLWGGARGLDLVVHLSDRVGGIRGDAPLERVTLKALNHERTLVATDTSIADVDLLSKIGKCLRDAVPWDPNHPDAQWQCLMEVQKEGGEYACVVTLTRRQGTLVSIYSGRTDGWLLAEYRSDELGKILTSIAVEGQEAH
ncbi:MAG: hypothetical protein ACP5HU_12195 [Phycisphaerae bacterium]